MSKNPVKAWREAKGFTPEQLAIVADISFDTVRYVETGKSKTLPPSWREVVALLGGDYDALAREYDLWRKQETARLLQGR